MPKNHVFVMQSGHAMFDRALRLALEKDRRFETWMLETADDLALHAYRCGRTNERFIALVPLFSATHGPNPRKYLEVRLRKCLDTNNYTRCGPFYEPFDTAMVAGSVEGVIHAFNETLSVSGIFATEDA